MEKLSKLEMFSLSLVSLNSVVITFIATFSSMIYNKINISFIPDVNYNNKKTQMQKAIEKTIIRVAVYNNNAYWVVDNAIYRASIDDNGDIDDSRATPINVFDLSEREVDNLLAIIDSIS